MREIGRDDDQRLGPAPDRVEHGGGRLRRSLAGDDWDQVEFAEHHLQEWQVNLVFSCMGCIEHADQLGLDQALGRSIGMVPNGVCQASAESAASP